MRIARTFALALALLAPSVASAQWLGMPPWSPMMPPPFFNGPMFPRPYYPPFPAQPPIPPEPVARPLSRHECINFAFAAHRPSAFLKLRIERSTPDNRKVLRQRALFVLKFDTDPLARGTARWVFGQLEAGAPPAPPPANPPPQNPPPGGGGGGEPDHDDDGHDHEHDHEHGAR
jgi:hypothetical protein